MRVWIGVGTGDPFHETDTAFAQSLRDAGGRVTFHAWPGGHNSEYWNAHLGQYFAF
jgi:acetyl esterase/lipase